MERKGTIKIKLKNADNPMSIKITKCGLSEKERVFRITFDDKKGGEAWFNLDEVSYFTFDPEN